MRILLATDGSEFSAAAADELAQRPFTADCEVRVISVVTPYYPTMEPWGGMDMRFYEAIEKSARDEARSAVDKATARIKAGGEGRKLNVTAEVLVGPAKQVILDDAEAFGADLIVVGSHGHGRLQRFMLGSVSQAVALHATCSVEIVRKNARAAVSGTDVQT